MNRITFLFLFAISCGQTPSNKESKADTSTVTQQVVSKQNALFSVDEATQTIIDKYKVDFEGKAKMEETVTDSSISLNFTNIPNAEDNEEHVLLSVDFPKKESGYIFGDLDNDGIDEAVVDVHTEGGGGGGNIWWNDIFVFKKIETKYKLVTSVSSPEICGCEQGFFAPEKIQNSVLMGSTACYTKEDPQCCPSLNGKASIKLVGNKLQFQSAN